MLILNPLEKFEKTHMKKLITNKATEKLGVLTFINVCKSFRRLTFFNELEIKFAVYDIHTYK
jgi:hypothetical protein